MRSVVFAPSMNAPTEAVALQNGADAESPAEEAPKEPELTQTDHVRPFSGDCPHLVTHCPQLNKTMLSSFKALLDGPAAPSDMISIATGCKS